MYSPSIIANALVPAAVGKLFGWGAANFASFLWTWLGVYLGVLWFLRVVGRTSLAIGLLFLFFGGLDVIGRTLLLGWPSEPTRLLGNWMVEYALSSTPEARRMMAGVFWYFPSNLSFVYYAPQHVLGPWLCVLMLLYDAVRRQSCHRVVFLWSAFNFIGLMPFLGLALIVTRGRNLFSFENTVAAGCVGILTFLFMNSNNQHFPHGFLWERQDLYETGGLLLLFYFLEFGLYAMLRPRIEPDDPNAIQAVWWWLALACLLLAPWYVLGQFNDLTT